MATLTELITEELMDSTGNPEAQEGVLRKYSGSKGPLYKALATARTKSN